MRPFAGCPLRRMDVLKKELDTYVLFFKVKKSNFQRLEHSSKLRLHFSMTGIVFPLFSIVANFLNWDKGLFRLPPKIWKEITKTRAVIGFW